MIKCIYTTQKQKKLKTWLDGFIKVRGKKFCLYDVDKTSIHSSITTSLDNEIETARYLIYVESFDDSSEEGRETSEEKIQGNSTQDRIEKCKGDPENRFKRRRGCIKKQESPKDMESMLGIDQGDKESVLISKGRTEEEIIKLFK